MKSSTREENAATAELIRPPAHMDTHLPGKRQDGREDAQGCPCLRHSYRLEEAQFANPAVEIGTRHPNPTYQHSRAKVAGHMADLAVTFIIGFWTGEKNTPNTAKDRGVAVKSAPRFLILDQAARLALCCRLQLCTQPGVASTGLGLR